MEGAIHWIFEPFTQEGKKEVTVCRLHFRRGGLAYGSGPVLCVIRRKKEKGRERGEGGCREKGNILTKGAEVARSIQSRKIGEIKEARSRGKEKGNDGCTALQEHAEKEKVLFNPFRRKKKKGKGSGERRGVVPIRILGWQHGGK